MNGGALVTLDEHCNQTNSHCKHMLRWRKTFQLLTLELANQATIHNGDHLLSLGNILHYLAKTKTDTMTNRKTSHNRDHLVTLALASKDWWWMLCAGKEGIPHPANSRRRHSPNVRPQWHLQLLCHHHDSTTKTQPLQNKEFLTHRSVQSHFIHIER